MSCCSSAVINPKFAKYSLPVLFLCFSICISAQEGPVLIIKGFKNEKGKALIRITDDKGWVIDAIVKDIHKNQVSLALNREGHMAIEVFHDENNNGKLDKALPGYPVESWGVSNNVRPKFRAPALKEMLTEVRMNTEIIILVK